MMSKCSKRNHRAVQVVALRVIGRRVMDGADGLAKARIAGRNASSSPRLAGNSAAAIKVPRQPRVKSPPRNRPGATGPHSSTWPSPSSC